jgi:hypothetical protein
MIDNDLILGLICIKFCVVIFFVSFLFSGIFFF